MYGTGFRGAARRRRRDGRARARRGRACRCSRSTSRRASTARPARSPGAAVRATETICFAAYKPGLLFEPGRTHAGRVHGRRHRHRDRRRPATPQLAGARRRPISRCRRPRAESHKWSSGCLVVGGSSGMIGAPLLAGQRRAAQRRGHGRVRGARARPRPRRCRASELVARALPATADGALDEDAAAAVLKELGALPRARDRPRARPRPARRRPRCAGSSPRPTSAIVIDADALNALAVDPVGAARRGTRPGFRSRCSRRTRGEYERLAGRPVGDDRVDGRARPRARACTRSCC